MTPQLNLPGLQRAASRACVSCGGAAEAYCARCGVTPYCSERCQRRDWPARHSTVCHNLARLNDVLDVNNTVAAPTSPSEAPAPLRRPHSPGPAPASASARGPVRDRDERDGGSNKKFLPPGHNPKPCGRSPRDSPRSERAEDQPPAPGPSASGAPGRQHDRPPRHFGKPDMNKPMRRPLVEDDDWGFKGSKPEPKTNGSHEPKPKGQKPVETNRTESQPPMRDAPATGKPANQEAPLPAKSATRSTVGQPPQAARQTEAAAAPAPAPAPATPAKPPGDASGTTPSTKLVPKNCVIETLSVGDTVYLQVDNTAAECACGDSGFVCVSLGDAHMESYQALCETYTVEDESPVAPRPGATVSLWEPTDGAWYRARVLSAERAALLDASKVLPLGPGAKLAALPPQYAHIPEFCCLLQADVKIGDNFTGTVVEKTGRGWKVSLECEGAAPRSGEVARWLPAVSYPQPPPASLPAPIPTTTPATTPVANNASVPPAKPAAAPAPAAVARPAVSHNAPVLLVHYTGGADAQAPPADLFVRPADARALRAFDAALHDVMLYGLTAAPLSEPPRAGQFVVGKFTDGVHYRALVRRTSVARDKYQLEYLEYGNIHVAQLKDLCACPPHLSVEQVPVLTSRVALEGASLALTPAAETYLEALKEDTELLLTLPNGEKTAPSGAEVILTVAKNKDSVNKRVQELSTPEWLALQQKGGDVVDVEPVMYSSLTWLDLGAAAAGAGGEVTVLDVSALHNGLLSACPARHPHMALVLGSLTARINAYCESELGREPYLPKEEELCLAQLPPYPQWFRAVVLSHSPGAAEAEVNYIDYGTVARAPVAHLRKMLREFIDGLPALASTLIIRGFPKTPTTDQLLRAAEFMQINDDGQGTLRVTNCKLESAELPGLYEVNAPELLEAMGQ